MSIEITRHEKYAKKVFPSSIHGMYPYKTYLEIIGNSGFGNYIVVVSTKDIDKKELNEVSVRLGNRVSNKNKTNIVKPNTANNGYYVRYRVKELSILDVQDKEVFVFRLENESNI